MKLTIFKPNPSNKGGFVSLKVATTKNNKKDVWEKTLFAEFVPQKSWSESTKSGTFDASKRRTVAINVGEAGEMLNSMRFAVPFQNYHESGGKSCWVKFLPYKKARKVGKEGDKSFWQGDVDNYAFGYSEKGAGVNVPFTCGEAECLKLLLESFIKESMAIDAKEEEKKFKKKDASSQKEEEPETEQEVEEEDNSGGGADDGSDDIPFAQFWKHSPLPL